MKFVVSDSHACVRKALESTLKQISAHAQVLHTHRDRELPSLLHDHPDIALCLIESPPLVTCTTYKKIMARIRTAHPCPVVFVSADEEPERIRKALLAGAAGYLPRSLPENTVRAALSLILSGSIYLPPSLLPLLTERTKTASVMTLPKGKERRITQTAISPILTERQTDVAKLIMKGCSNREIGHSLGITESTVKVHVASILKAYKSKSRLKLASLLREELATHLTGGYA